VQFVTDMLASVQNPHANPNSHYQGATSNLNANACYAYDSAYACGDGTLANNKQMVTNLVKNNHFGVGNHTIDHLENWENCGICGTPGWAGIPACWKDPQNNGWLPCGSDTCNAGQPSTGGPAANAGTGPGGCMDEATWSALLPVNDSALISDYSLPSGSVTGFRAPRLEMNDLGLQAVKAMHYEYDDSLEEIQPPGWVNAAVDADTGSMHGFNWFPWPYTLDNGSPGIWNQQIGGDKAWVTNFPNGLWELPVYEVYVPSKGGLGTTIANRMLAADTSCTVPPGFSMPSPGHCFLSPGELSLGQAETEITGFDFNTFVYCRMQPSEWLTTMQHTFLLRYYGGRAPLTYGAHPIEYTQPYDSFTLGSPGCDISNTCAYSAGNPNNCCQANNFAYRDVTMNSTYTSRQTAMKQFVQWIQSGPYAKDTYFMSFPDLVSYMQHPFDKNGNAVLPDTVASPDSNGIFSRLAWSGTGATIHTTSGNAATITFTIANPGTGNSPDIASVQAALSAGALQNVSHIDIKYKTQVPFRIRLLTSDGSTTVTALLAGVGGDRLARIRVKDLFPGPEAAESQVASLPLVDASYMAKVNGIAFESAATMVAPSGTPASFAGGTFTTTIEQITLHGVATSGLCQ
jgi:hypothetical protein